MHLQNANLYGNSTDLQYFYVDLYVGSEKQKLLTMPGSATAQWLLRGNGKEGAIVDQHMP